MSPPYTEKACTSPFPYKHYSAVTGGQTADHRRNRTSCQPDTDITSREVTAAMIAHYYVRAIRRSEDIQPQWNGMIAPLAAPAVNNLLGRINERIEPFLFAAATPETIPRPFQDHYDVSPRMVKGRSTAGHDTNPIFERHRPARGQHPKTLSRA
jgi:hypothetical protein